MQSGKYIYTLVLTLCLVLFSQTSKAQWEKKNTGVTDLLENIYFIDNQYGFACGWKGTLLKTTDSGNTWTEVSTLQNLIYKDVVFTDSLKGLVVGEDQFMFKTYNAGQNWTQINTTSDLTRPLQGIEHYQQKQMIAVGFNYYIISSKDTGNIWTKDSINVIDTSHEILSIYDVTILPGGKCIAVGDSSMILHKDINDSIWQQMFIGGNIPLKGVHFIDDSIGFVAGGTVDTGTLTFINVFYKTTDGGKTWSNGKFINDGGTINNVSFVNADTGFVISNSGRIFRTYDGGDNWVRLISTTPSTLYGIHFFNNTSGMICGDGGLILKTGNLGGFPVGINQVKVKADINIYPNPASDYIQFDLGSATVSHITIANTSGQLYTLKLQNNRLVDISDLPNGIYIIAVYYTLPTDNKTIQAVSKKVLINR